MGSTQKQRQNGKTSSDCLSSNSTAPSSSSRYNTESPTQGPPSCVPTDVIESVWNLKSPRSQSSTHSSVNHSTAEVKDSNIRDTRTHDNNTQRHTHTKTTAANESNNISSNDDSSKYDNSNSNSASGGNGKGASFSLLDSSPTRNSMFRNRSRIPSFNQRCISTISNYYYSHIFYFYISHSYSYSYHSNSNSFSRPFSFS